jgi:polyhydroxybutyrate depolymerase
MLLRRSLLTAAVLTSVLTGTVATAGATAAGAAVLVQASAGCRSTAAPTPDGATLPYAAAGDTGTYVVEGTGAQHRGHPLPLVVDLHGYSETAGIQVVISQLGAYGTAHGFLTVTPQVDEAGQHWITSPRSADQRFLITLVTHVLATQCVDANRVFVAGYSNGAFMASALACSDAGTIAAVATVAGIEAVPDCHPSRRVPVIAFHGTADPFVPYTGGVGPSARNLPAPSGNGTIGDAISTATAQRIQLSNRPVPVEAARWAARNGCAATPKTSAAAPGVTLIAWSCPKGAAVELYRENGDGHIWAGSPSMPAIASTVGRSTSAISADRLMWAFFQAHPR